MIDGQHRLITEPQRLGGEGSGPAPHELFPPVLAACVSTTLVMYARRERWELGEVRVEVIAADAGLPGVVRLPRNPDRRLHRWSLGADPRPSPERLVIQGGMS